MKDISYDEGPFFTIIQVKERKQYIIKRSNFCCLYVVNKLSDLERNINTWKKESQIGQDSLK